MTSVLPVAGQGFPRLLIRCCLVLLVALPALARAQLDVAPTRLNIGDGERAAVVMVVNRADEPRTFRIGVLDVDEHEDGSRELLEEPGEGPHHAASMVRYSPRQATLAPGERQVVRFQARRPPELPEGEYRARVAIQTLPSARSPREQSSEEGVNINIEVLFAVTLPLAITQGDPSVEVGIGGARAVDEGAAIAVERSGNASAYGRLRVYAADDGSRGEPLAERRRAVVVVPLERRLFRFPDLAVEPGDQLHVVYDALESEGGGTLAQRTITVEAP